MNNHVPWRGYKRDYTVFGESIDKSQKSYKYEETIWRQYLEKIYRARRSLFPKFSSPKNIDKLL